MLGRGGENRQFNDLIKKMYFDSLPDEGGGEGVGGSPDSLGGGGGGKGGRDRGCSGYGNGHGGNHGGVLGLGHSGARLLEGGRGSSKKSGKKDGAATSKDKKSSKEPVRNNFGSGGNIERLAYGGNEGHRATSPLHVMPGREINMSRELFGAKKSRNYESHDPKNYNS
jgi:hypothetical protein